MSLGDQPLSWMAQQQDPTQQLESQAGPARQGLGQALQQNQPADLSSPIQQQIQNEQNAIQAQQPTSNRGGPIKRLLFNFLQGAGDAMKRDVGLPTSQQIEQRHVQNLIGLSNAQSMEGFRQSEIQRNALMAQGLQQGQMPISQNDATAMGMPWLAGRTWAEGLGMASKYIPANLRGQYGLQQETIRQGGGLQLPVDNTTASLAGAPELAGKTLGMGGWKMLNSALQAKGYKVQDMGTDGPDGGMWVVDRGGNKVSQVSDKSLTKARGIGYAQGRAEYTPFETVEPGTNIPTTISAAQALNTGAPRVSATQAQNFGTRYAQFNDAYGILDNIDQQAQKVNLADAGTRAKVTAAYAALKEPASNGLAGEVLSNFFARQPIYNSLNQDERDLVLSMAQGKAAATGLRGILGQAGTNEMQQRLDAGLMPGGQTLASADTVHQQTKAMRGLLDRFVVGQPQVGLNAPGSATALNRTTGKSPSGFAAWKARQNAR